MKSFLFFFLFLTLISCGQGNHSYSSNELKVTPSSVIIGELQWESITQKMESFLYQASRATAYIQIPALSSRCTGSLISPELLITNHHCIKDKSDAEGVLAAFNYIDNASGKDFDVYDCSEFVMTSKELDFTILRCLHSPGLSHGFLELSDSPPEVDDDILIYHQNCDYYKTPNCIPTKKLSRGKVLYVSEGQKVAVAHDADTLGGSSGASILDALTMKMVALHNIGVTSNHGDEKKDGRGSYNLAVPAYLIYAEIQHLL